jgi:phage-related minor tail protein
MGEQGAEAILPLARGSDGRLGVRSATGGASSRPVSVTVNVAATDADSFRRSEAQVAAALARAVARGQRGL